MTENCQQNLTPIAEQALPVMQSANQRNEGGSIPTARLFKAQWRVHKSRIDLAQYFTRTWHYSAHGSNTAVLVCGLWQVNKWLDMDCYGITWWLPPTKSAGMATYPDDPQGVLSLSRCVCRPDAPSNAASFMLRHSMRFIDRGRWPVLVTYADEWQGHDGGIYKALHDAGWIHEGWTKPEKTYLIRGRMISRKAGLKTRTHSEMLALGAECVGSFRRKKFVNRIV